MGKFFKKYKLYIIIAIIISILLLMFLFVKQFLYSNDLAAMYGNRLSGINEVVIEDGKLDSVSKKIKSNEHINITNVDIRGKIIYIYMNVSSELSSDKAKEILNEAFKLFSEDEVAFYDFQLSSNNEEKKEIVTGTKSSKTKDIVWSLYKEVE